MEQLAATTVWFGEQVNAAADTVPRDETGLFAVGKEKILLNTGHVYDGIVAEYPFLAGPHRSPKPAFYSKLMSAAGFTGYLCPLFGESTLNVDCPAVFCPPPLRTSSATSAAWRPSRKQTLWRSGLPPPVVMRHMNIPAG